MKQHPTKRRGRPREFDREDALRIAMNLFGRHGYEGVGISDLTQAMQIAPPSLYAAFGSKEALYREALKSYWARRTLLNTQQEKPIRDQIVEMLKNAVVAATDPEHPSVCRKNTLKRNKNRAAK